MKRKFSHCIQFWSTPEQVSAFEALDANGLLSKSDHYRAALQLYLAHIGARAAPTPKQSANGHHQENCHGL